MLSSTEVRADKSDILIYNSKQAIKLNSDLKKIKSIDFTANEYSDNIVNISNDLTKMLYYDNEGLKIADTDFKNAKLLFKHPDWSDDPVERTIYSNGYFFNNDTMIFSYTRGRDDNGMLASRNLAVYNLKDDKIFTNDSILGWHDSCSIDIRSNSVNIVNLMYNDEKNAGYSLINFDCQNNNFSEKKLISIPADKLIGTPTLSNAYVGLNDRYIVYTRFDDNNSPAIYRYDMNSGKTVKKSFQAGDYKSESKSLEFIPYSILHDGKVAIHYHTSGETYLTDFSE